MRWKDMTGPERYRVVEMARRGERPLVEICQAFEVSRQTLHKAMERAEQAAMEALEPQTPGRKGPSEQQLQIGELEKKTTGLEKQVDHWKMRYEVAQAFINLSREAEQRQERNRKKKKNSDALRMEFLNRGLQTSWPYWMMAEMLGVKTQSLERWMSRHKTAAPNAHRRGRPEVIPSSVRWKLRSCYLSHYRQWGPSVLGRFSTGAIARVIEDLKPLPPQERVKPQKYEIAAPMVMWSEDGTGLVDRGQKRELLVLQDECSRFKTNWRMARTSATAVDVEVYLREAEVASVV